MFVVRFIRVDRKPNEDYYYANAFDAIAHMKLFVNDTSGLYERVQLISLEDKEIVVTQLEFA